MKLDADEPLAVAVVGAIRSGDVAELNRLLDAHAGLARARIGDGVEWRTLLHVATDWPSRLPNSVATVTALVGAGADVDAPFVGAHAETPLHWAASGDDVEVLDALLDAGADIEASGAVIGGGTPLADAVAFAQWRAARRLVERGARVTLREAAALGLMDRVERYWSADEPPPATDVTEALWYACHGGQRVAARYLLDRGAELNWVSRWDGLTPLDAAQRHGAPDLVDWLRASGGRSARELP